jgi:hypothetical protein
VVVPWEEEEVEEKVPCHEKMAWIRKFHYGYQFGSHFGGQVWLPPPQRCVVVITIPTFFILLLLPIIIIIHPGQ